MFVDVPTACPFRSIIWEDCQHVLSELWTDHERDDHFSFYLIGKWSLFITIHCTFGGKVRIQVSRASKERRFPITTIPCFRSIFLKPVHGAGIKLLA